MRRFGSSVLFLTGFLLGGVPDHALAIATADLVVSESAPTNVSEAAYNTFNWDYCFNYKNASSVAVDHYWILTAAHVGDDTANGDLDIDGVIYEELEVVQHPFADLALVRYDKPLPGYYLLADTVPVGSEIMFCGFGFSGDVISTSSQAYFTDNLTGWKTKRWGSNRIDRELTYPYSGPAPLGITTNQGFEITISTTPRRGASSGTDYEAGGNVYDSGSGMFYDDGGTWKLVGTMTTRTNNTFNYTGNFAVATAHHADWIKSVITDYDTDMDGLPDWWEASTGETEAGADPDEDGFTNYQEWLGDTDPGLGTSFLDISAYTNASSLVFESSSDRKYLVEYCANLTNQNWKADGGWFVPTSSQTVHSVSQFDSNRFYRVRAMLP